MIDILLCYDDEKRKLRLTVRGHSDAAPIGEDLICAAASILTYTVAYIFDVMHGRGELESYERRLESGDALIYAVCKDAGVYAEASHAVFVAQTGYLLLSAQYPEHVAVKTLKGSFGDLNIEGDADHTGRKEQV